jgi:hypothetical protein
MVKVLLTAIFELQAEENIEEEDLVKELKSEFKANCLRRIGGFWYSNAENDSSFFCP